MYTIQNLKVTNRQFFVKLTPEYSYIFANRNYEFFFICLFCEKTLLTFENAI